METLPGPLALNEAEGSILIVASKPDIIGMYSEPMLVKFLDVEYQLLTGYGMKTDKDTVIGD